MLSVTVQDAKAEFARLLDAVLEGETVLITRNGEPAAELRPAHRRPFPLGAGRHDPAINPSMLASDEWWRPMTDAEADSFLEGRF